MRAEILPMPHELPATLALLCALLPACAAPSASAPPSSSAAPADAPPAPPVDNALLARWTGPYGGVPAFDRLELGALKPALERAMAVNLEEIEALARDPRPPTFANTIVALERTGRDLDRVQAYFGIWSSNLSTSEFRAVQTEMAPKLSEHSSRIIQNEALFARVRALWDARASSGLRPDEERLVQLVYERFEHNGATMAGPARQRYPA